MESFFRRRRQRVSFPQRLRDSTRGDTRSHKVPDGSVQGRGGEGGRGERGGWDQDPRLGPDAPPAPTGGVAPFACAFRADFPSSSLPEGETRELLPQQTREGNFVHGEGNLTAFSMGGFSRQVLRRGVSARGRGASLDSDPEEGLPLRNAPWPGESAPWSGDPPPYPGGSSPWPGENSPRSKYRSAPAISVKDGCKENYV